MILTATRNGVELRIYVADVRDLVGDASLADVADVAFWSPPYKKKDGWSTELMVATGELVGRGLHDKSWAFMNFGQLKESYTRPAESAAAVARSPQLTQHQTYIWLKSLAIDGTQRGHYQPLQGTNILNYCFEYVFGFYTGSKPPPLDRLAVGAAFADKSNLTRGGRGRNGDVHCAGDVWWLPYRTTGATAKKAHAYEFPTELPSYALRLAGVPPGGTVIDPFFGSGSTGLAARRFGLHCIGIERDLATAQRAVNRWLSD